MSLFAARRRAATPPLNLEARGPQSPTFDGNVTGLGSGRTERRRVLGASSRKSAVAVQPRQTGAGRFVAVARGGLAAGRQSTALTKVGVVPTGRGRYGRDATRLGDVGDEPQAWHRVAGTRDRRRCGWPGRRRGLKRRGARPGPRARRGVPHGRRRGRHARKPTMEGSGPADVGRRGRCVALSNGGRGVDVRATGRTCSSPPATRPTGFGGAGHGSVSRLDGLNGPARPDGFGGRRGRSPPGPLGPTRLGRVVAGARRGATRRHVQAADLFFFFLGPRGRRASSAPYTRPARRQVPSRQGGATGSSAGRGATGSSGGRRRSPAIRFGRRGQKLADTQTRRNREAGQGRRPHDLAGAGRRGLGGRAAGRAGSAGAVLRAARSVPYTGELQRVSGR